MHCLPQTSKAFYARHSLPNTHIFVARKLSQRSYGAEDIQIYYNRLISTNELYALRTLDTMRVRKYYVE